MSNVKSNTAKKATTSKATKAKATKAPAKAKATKAPAPVKVKKASLKEQATKYWNEELAKRTAGAYAEARRPNRDFRAVVTARFEKELGVTHSSAATMYNAFKIEATIADPKIALGRDPKVVAVKAPKKEKAVKAGEAPKETKAEEEARLAKLEAQIEDTDAETPASETAEA